MRALIAAIARAIQAVLGILWMPFQFVGGLFSGGGGSRSPQDDAALVAQRAADQEMARDMEVVADKPLELDEVATVKRVCGRLLMGKPIAPGTRLSPSVLEALAGLSRPMLKSLADAAPQDVNDYIDGYRASYLSTTAQHTGRTPEQLQATFPKLAARIAARTGSSTTDEVAIAWGVRQPA